MQGSFQFIVLLCMKEHIRNVEVHSISGPNILYPTTNANVFTVTHSTNVLTSVYNKITC